MTHRARPFCFIVNERRFRPTTSTHIQLRVIFEHSDQQAASGGESSQVQHRTDGVGACCLLGEPSLPPSVTSLLSPVHEAVKRKRERGGYNAGVVAVVCHKVPIDKGTSESSLLGAGSPLPSIPLHSSRRVLYRLRPDTSMERKDFIENLHFSIFFDPHAFRYSRNYGLIVPT
jgi:hypothetical protein